MSIKVAESLVISGVDIGGSGAKAVLVKAKDGQPSLLEESFREIPSEVNKGPQHVVRNVIPQVLRESAQLVGIDPDEIQAVGICFPAPVSFDGRTLSVGNMQNPAWEGFEVESEIVTTIGRRDSLTPTFIIVENDAAATIPALLQAGERGRVAGYFVGTGVGGAMTIDGINQFRNAGGGSEPGATTFLFDEDEVLFGRRGLVEKLRMEDYVSLVGIERLLEKMHRAKEIPEGHEILTLQGSEHKTAWRARAERLLSYACEALENGNLNDFSLRIMDVSRKALGSYIQGILNFNRMDKVFIGGGVVDSRRVTSQFREWYLNGVREAASESTVQPLRRELGFPKFIAAELGDITAPYGAALTGWNAWQISRSSDDTTSTS